MIIDFAAAPARAKRARIEREIDRLIELLDVIDGDLDLEPSLGWPEGGPDLLAPTTPTMSLKRKMSTVVTSSMSRTIRKMRARSSIQTAAIEVAAMSRAKFRQADVERLIKAAGRQGAALNVDLYSMVVTIIPAIHRPGSVDTATGLAGTSEAGTYAPDGKENWDED